MALDAVHQAAVERLAAQRPPLTAEQAALVRRVFGRCDTQTTADTESAVRKAA